MSTTMAISDAKRLLLERRLRGGNNRPQPEADTVRPRPADAPVPVSPEQGQVWIHASVTPHLPVYNAPITIHRRGPFSLDALQRSFDEILRRHEAWRTSFELTGGEVMQVVHPTLQVELPLIDLSSLPRAAAEQETLRIAAADARAPIRIDAVPLFRAVVVKLGPEEHRLQLTIHHIIFDGVSIYRVLMPELAALYETFASGSTQGQLPAPTLQYGDYAIWRRQQVGREELSVQMQHWQRELAGELPMLQLPFDRPRPAMETHRGATELFSLTAELTDALNGLSRAEGVTPYMVLLAAFKTLLFRYTGQEDVIVGGITDARRRPELERLIGYFLNPIALRTRPLAALAFRDYLVQVRDTTLGALGASDVPFDRVVRELNIPRDPASHPVFTVLFSIQPPVELADPAWDLTQMDVGTGTAKFDLYLELESRPGGLIARFNYNSDLFDASTVQRMVGHYTTLLQGITAEPGCALGALPMLTSSETHLLRDVWNQTARPSPRTTLHGLFEQQARRSPLAPAVTFEGQTWTYAELDQQANRIALQLRRAGAGPGRLVALCVERSREMLAGILAILKTGAAYMPLDPALPPARVKFTVEDAAPVLLLTQRSLAPGLPPGVPVLLLDDPAPDASPGEPVTIDLNSPAYVLYTSGTTGRPKGVEVSHASVVNVVAALADTFECWAGDTLLAVTTLSFDPSLLELFMTLATGGHIVVASHEIAADPVMLAELTQRSACTVLHATPTTWRWLLESGWTCPPGFKALCGGENLPRELADALLSRGARLWNLYGPTETTIVAVVHEVSRGSGPVPVGRPVANVTTAILDGQGNLLPVGVVGDLHIGGAGVALGYRNREELTRERFIVREGERMYRSGDMARYRPDGMIEYLGRRDGQVKVRGFRIELGEVEGALATHPRVAAAAVLAAPDSSGETGLVGYIETGSEPAPDAAELRAFLKATLPDYMIPSRFVALEMFPVGHSGKLDRTALPELAPSLPAAVSDEPRNEWERRVARVWSDVLGVGAIGRNDNFFDLGGHSILVAKLQQRIGLEFERTLSLATLFQAQTVAQLARVLRELGGSAGERLLQVQPSGSLPRLFWLEPSPAIRFVADALGRDQPLLGLSLDAADLETLGEAPSLEAMAGCLVSTLLDAEPTGPYQLIGICNKGVLAFEMAKQLAAAGHAVKALIIVDGENPATRRRTGSVAVELSKLRFHLAAAWRLSGRDRLRYGFKRARHVVDRVIPLRSVPDWGLPIDPMLSRAVHGYAPKSYAGDVTILRSAARPDQVDTAVGWRKVVTGDLMVRDVPGMHETLLQPHNIGGLAEAIRDALARTAR